MVWRVCLIIIITGLHWLNAGSIDTLYILQTTDVHGNLLPYDYYRDKPADHGLAKVYTRVIEYRQKHKNVLLLDGGDLLQGTPLSYYFNQIETNGIHPLILTLNYMGYDAMAVGNHDIEQGVAVYNRCRRQSQFAWLSANAVLEDGRLYFEPYTIIRKGDIEIGVLGLTTPAIPMWLDSTLYPGIHWRDMVATARDFVPKLRPKVDVLVGLFHAGFDAGYSMEQTKALGLPNENASGLVAGQVDDFDVIFGGHSHRPFAGNKAHPLRMNAGSRAQNLAVVQLILKKEGQAGADYTITEVKGWLEEMDSAPSARSIMQLNDEAHQKTLAYIRTEIARAADTLNARQARRRDTAIIELINRAQLRHTGADFSFAAAFNTDFVLPPGPVRIKDVYNMYWYENFLYTVEMTGRQIKDYLEYCARYFRWNGTSLQTNPEMAGYNYDMAEGVGYTINVSNAPGNRISNLVDLRTGQPLQMDKTYKAAMNSYRAAGGGGHTGAVGLKSGDIIYKSSEEMRNILIDYIKEKETLNARVDGNWKIVH